MSEFLFFVIGTMLGGMVGVVLMCLMQINRLSERKEDADAKKEFSLSAMTGFGADGSREEMEQDFEQVRGVFESNPFVTAVLQHIEAKTALGNELIERIASI